MKCKYCGGGGEVRGIPHGYEDDGTEACPCCKGEGVVSKAHYRKFMKAQIPSPGNPFLIGPTYQEECNL